MASLTMPPAGTIEDDQHEPEGSALKHVQGGTIPSQLDQSPATPQSGLYHTLLNKSHSAPQPSNPSVTLSGVPSSGLHSTTLPTRTRKRNSNGEIKQMVAELSARADLAISRSQTTTPEGWKIGHALPFPGHWVNDLDQELLRKYPSVVSYSPRSPRTLRSTCSMVGGSKDVDEEHGQGITPEKRKRQGSLLEWRNKEMFEEPVRI